MQKNWLSLWIILLGAFVAVIGSAGALYAQANADWTEPFPPFKIAGNLYYVGSKGLANYLIATPQGHILGVRLSQSDAERPAALGSGTKRNGDGRAQYYFSYSHRVPFRILPFY